MRISDWSSDVCSSDLGYATIANGGFMIDPYLITEVRDVDGKVLYAATPKHACLDCSVTSPDAVPGDTVAAPPAANAGTENLAPRTIDPQVDWLIADMMHDVAVRRSEEHTSELQSLMRISHAVFCSKKKKK